MLNFIHPYHVCRVVYFNSLKNFQKRVFKKLHFFMLVHFRSTKRSSPLQLNRHIQQMFGRNDNIRLFENSKHMYIYR